ncbi:MAG: flippase [Bacteroidaceae bacterium]|jgi:O-antigen/teichoic acid export membrane protein|nr:flippase [Bacteroidaceae bacterium]
MHFINNANISEKKKRALKNIAWAMGGKVASLLSVLVVGIIVARYLGEEKYGIMNYVISFVAIFQVFADFGLDLIQIREESKEPSMRDKIIGTTFALKLCFALIAFIAIFFVAWFMEDDLSIRIYIMIYACSVILNTTWVSRNHFTSIVWNEYVVKTEISRTLIGMLVKIVLVWLKLPLIWFICSLVLDSILLATGYTMSYSSKIGSIKRWSFDKSLARYMIKQSFPLLLSGAAIVIYNRIDQVMIGNMMVNKAHLGIYSVAIRFTEILVFVPTIIAQTVTPMLVETRRVSLERYEKMSRVFMNITVVTCILLAILVSLLSYPIVYCTFGATYIGASSVLSIMAFKVVGDALSQTSGQLMVIEGIQKYASIRNLIGCATCVVCNWFFIRRYGIHGAAYVALITIFVSGTLADFFIPIYRKIFYKQISALCLGWKDMLQIKTLLR